METWDWGIENKTYTSAQVLGRAKLVKDMEKVPTFYIPEIIDDNTASENVTVKILASDEKENYAENRTTITIVNSIKAKPGGPYEVYEGQTIKLDGRESGGKDKEYNWGIKNPSEDTSLENDLTSTPTFHAPQNIAKKEEVEMLCCVNLDKNFYL
ncbi:hypothetical protein AKJ56_01055 [candidate division MSBL1 archaeon SCGC-AAA382N08]|uniref:Uncharacterized protein n=1 Tax=candidate division MSBL1 archaeon SCGC-AAA382N08 TaxID=1698285 RepID=A0A133VQ30_9EURY|nr:hypothetical protein AKJ56_01055 [candidate division MSBL1 archaeon SCGC-AAA382N08]